MRFLEKKSKLLKLATIIVLSPLQTMTAMCHGEHGGSVRLYLSGGLVQAQPGLLVPTENLCSLVITEPLGCE